MEIPGNWHVYINEDMHAMLTELTEPCPCINMAESMKRSAIPGETGSFFYSVYLVLFRSSGYFYVILKKSKLRSLAFPALSFRKYGFFNILFFKNNFF